MKLHHFAVWTGDINRLAGFYLAHFDCFAGPSYFNPRTGFRSRFLHFSDGGSLEIMAGLQTETSDRKERSGYAHLAISLPNPETVDHLTQLLARGGSPVLDGPRFTGDGYYESKLADPDGNLIELTTPASPPRPLLALRKVKPGDFHASDQFSDSKFAAPSHSVTPITDANNPRVEFDWLAEEGSKMVAKISFARIPVIQQQNEAGFLFITNIWETDDSPQAELLDLLMMTAIAEAKASGWSSIFHGFADHLPALGFKPIEDSGILPPGKSRFPGLKVLPLWDGLSLPDFKAWPFLEKFGIPILSNESDRSQENY